MIQTKEDLRFYIKEDRWRNEQTGGRLQYWWYLLKGYEQAHAFRYIKCMRHCEYHLNNKGIFHRILYQIHHFRLMRLGLRYNMYIPLNTTGYGLRIMHITGGGGVHLSVRKIGNYCGFNAGSFCGVGHENDRPEIGDYVGFGPGAKAFGKIKIGSNSFVAPGAIVVKDIPKNSIVAGVPAKVIKTKNMG